VGLAADIYLSAHRLYRAGFNENIDNRQKKIAF